MKYILIVLLSAAFASLAGQTPALKNSAAHNVSTMKPTVHTVTTVSTVQPQPEQTVKVAAEVVIPKPAPEPTETASYASGCSVYDSMFRQYAWNVQTAEAICEAESNGNPYATSPPNYDGLRDFGLMQIHGEKIYNPSANIARAYQKYQSQGWHAWTTYSTGAYARFL